MGNIGRTEEISSILSGLVWRALLPQFSMNELVQNKLRQFQSRKNLIRRQLSGKELTDGITYLYNHYGSLKHVAEATGLPYNAVRNHVKYKRLIPKLKDMVDKNKVDIKVALKSTRFCYRK